jgi:hypothetical protein
MTTTDFANSREFNATFRGMTKDELYQHLFEGSGPFDFDSIDSIETTPELVAMLRETLTSTPAHGDDADGMIRNGLPASAAFLLGLHGSVEDVPLMMASMRQAIVDGRDWMNDALPFALAAMGPDALPAIIARIEALETTVEDAAADVELSLLILAASRLADAWPNALDPFVRFVVPRINDPANDARDRSDGFSPVRRSIAAMWVGAAFELVDPRLESAILDYFDRIGDDALFEAGDRDDYLERPKRRRRFDPRFMLFTRYFEYNQYLRALADRKRRTVEEFDEFMPPVSPEALHAALNRLESNAQPTSAPATITRAAHKIGRNDPCPCGSGRKYKKCCGKE